MNYINFFLFNRFTFPNYSLKIIVPASSDILNHYYNICSSLNDMQNSFLYGKEELEHYDSDWIFFIKENHKTLVTKPVKDEFHIESLTQFNEIIKQYRKICKKQISLSNSIMHQHARYETYKRVAKNKCAIDYRFISESLKTSNRIHKQRLHNLKEQYNNIVNKAESILDLFNLLEWLIYSNLRKSSTSQVIHQISNDSSSESSGLNWDLLTSDDLDQLLGVTFTQS